MRMGIRVLTSVFLVVEGPEKYWMTKDTTIRATKAENTHGFAVTDSNTDFGIGVLKPL